MVFTLNLSFLPGKVSSQIYRILSDNPGNSSRSLNESSSDHDINEILRNESAIAKYTNLLRSNIIEEEQYKNYKYAVIPRQEPRTITLKIHFL